MKIKIKMKKAISIVFTAVFLLLILTLPAAAAEGAKSGQECVQDLAGLLTYDERAELMSEARALSAEYGCGVYIVTVDDYRRYTSGSVVTCATDIFTQNEWGYGASGDGVLLLLSMAERDYALIAHGDLGNAAFTDYGKEKMADRFLRRFSDDDWYGGFSSYLKSCSKYLKMASEGEPFDVGNDDGSLAGRIGIVAGVPTVVAGIVSLGQSRKMKSVKRRTNASAYAAAAGLILRDQQDVYTHSTESRARIVSSSSGGGRSGGGGTSVGSGGFSSHSGKF